MNKLYIYFLCVNASLSLVASNWESKPLLQPSHEIAQRSKSTATSVKNKVLALAKNPVFQGALGLSALSVGSYVAWNTLYRGNSPESIVGIDTQEPIINPENNKSDHSVISENGSSDEKNNAVIQLQDNPANNAVVTQEELSESMLQRFRDQMGNVVEYCKDSRIDEIAAMGVGSLGFCCLLFGLFMHPGK